MTSVSTCSLDDWKYYAEKLAMDDIELKAVYPDLIDYFWTTGNGRPAQPNTPINALPMEFAGMIFFEAFNYIKVFLKHGKLSVLQIDINV